MTKVLHAADAHMQQPAEPQSHRQEMSKTLTGNSFASHSLEEDLSYSKEQEERHKQTHCIARYKIHATSPVTYTHLPPPAVSLSFPPSLLSALPCD